MSWKITPGWSPADADAAAYITAVETADNQALENGVKVAIDNFVLGCKADGIWPAIKASCILAGARTLAGALVPLVGTAPTNNNFVSGDYNRKTGLVGDGSTKHLDSNRNNNADPQDSQHMVVWVSTVTGSSGGLNSFPIYLGTGNATGSGSLGRNSGNSGNLFSRSRSTAATFTPGAATSLGLLAINRNVSSSYVIRVNKVNTTINVSSQARLNETIGVFRTGATETAFTYANGRLAFYSIGESLDLVLLDARVTDLINAFAAAIP